MLRHAFALLAATVMLFAAAPAALAAAPKVKAKPHAVMVGATTTLTGRHLPANSTLTISECGRTHWLAPADPCLHEDDVTLTTDAKGRFQTSFTVGLCPEGEATRRPTQRICWVGVLLYGEDTGELAGAAKLLVTYP